MRRWVTAPSQLVPIGPFFALAVSAFEARPKLQARLASQIVLRNVARVVVLHPLLLAVEVQARVPGRVRRVGVRAVHLFNIGRIQLTYVYSLTPSENRFFLTYNCF